MSAVDRSPASGPASDPRAELEALRTEREHLTERLARLEFERDGYYGEWQSAKNQLKKIRRSPAWPVSRPLATRCRRRRWTASGARAWR